MKIDLKVPCRIDMSVINKQMAVVDQKKAELKKAIDDLAHASVELVLGNPKKLQTNKFYLVEDEDDFHSGGCVQKKEPKLPSYSKQEIGLAEIKKEFLKTFDTVESNSPIADLYRHYNGKEMDLLLEEIWNVSFRFFNERLGHPEAKMPSYLDFETALNEANADILDHRDLDMVQEVWNVVLALFSGRAYTDLAKQTANVPDYPEWRDMLIEKQAGILELIACYSNLETEQAMEELYHLSKDFFNK